MTLTAVVIMELIALLLAAAYAWIESVNKPEIRGQNLSISASSGLDSSERGMEEIYKVRYSGSDLSGLHEARKEL